MAIKMVYPARSAGKPDNVEERAEAFIAGGISARPSLTTSEPEAGKTVVNSRWDTILLRQIDQAARKQGISRTAWLHVAAAEKLSR